MAAVINPLKQLENYNKRLKRRPKSETGKIYRQEFLTKIVIVNNKSKRKIMKLYPKPG